jgi:hypothetical protein
MLDPRRTLVLIQALSGAWEDKTAEIADLDTRGSQVEGIGALEVPVTR